MKLIDLISEGGNYADANRKKNKKKKHQIESDKPKTSKQKPTKKQIEIWKDARTYKKDEWDEGTNDMKLRKFLNEMGLPQVDSIQQATSTIQRAYEASMKGPVNQDVMGGLQAAMEWLQQQPGLGNDNNLKALQQKALAAKKKLDASRKPLASQEANFTTQKNKNSWGGSGNV